MNDRRYRKKGLKEFILSIVYMCHLRSVGMYEDLSRGSEWEEFRVDEKPFDNTYQEMRKKYRMLEEY